MTAHMKMNARYMLTLDAIMRQGADFVKNYSGDGRSAGSVAMNFVANKVIALNEAFLPENRKTMGFIKIADYKGAEFQ